MQKVNYIEIVCKTYHNDVVARLRFLDDNMREQESQLCSLFEINNILTLWKDGALLGSFGVGTILCSNYNFQLVNE